MLNQRGFTILELMVVFLIGLILVGTALINLKSLNNPLLNASSQMQSFLKKVRARAISSTQAYRVTTESATRVVTFRGNNCATATTADAEYVLNLPQGAQLTTTGWDICFTTRGLLDSNLQIDLQDQEGDARSIEVLLGGSVREL